MGTDRHFAVYCFCDFPVHKRVTHAGQHQQFETTTGRFACKPKTITPVLSSEQSLIKELASFQNKFSTVEHLPDQLDTLFRLTKAHQLVVDKAEYSLSEKSKTAIQRFEVILPVTGTYPQVKGLILEVLEKLPTVGLGDIVLEREQVGENRAKATLHLVFFVRKQA